MASTKIKLTLAQKTYQGSSRYVNRWWPTFLRIYASCGLEDLTNATYYKGTYFGTEAHRELEIGAT